MTNQDVALAKRLAAPGSPAERYAIHSGAIDEAYVDAYGSALPPRRTIPDEDRKTITIPSPGAEVVFSDFQFDRSNRLTDFSTFGTPVGGRLWSRPASTSIGGVKFQLVSAFEGVGGLLVALRMRSGVQPVQVSLSPTYSDASGSPSSPTEAIAPELLQPISEILIVAIFPQEKFGGTLAWEFRVDREGESRKYRATLPVK